MHYYRICSECNKPTLEADINAIIVKEQKNPEDYGEKVFYCGECFKAVTPEKVKKFKSTRK